MNSYVPFNFTKKNADEAAIRNDAQYALQVGLNYLRWCGGREALKGKTVLELGPGTNFGPALILKCAGAKAVYLADAFLSAWDSAYHPEVYRRLALELEQESVPFDTACIQEMLANNSHAAEGIFLCPSGAEELAGVRDASMDIILSNATLEHLKDFRRAFAAMYQKTAPGGMGYHQVDFRDHRDLEKPLEILLLSREEREAEAARTHCERGSWFRPDEYVAMLAAAGFQICSASYSLYAEEGYLNDFMDRLRQSDSEYRDYDRERLRPLGGFLVFKKSSQ